MVIVTVLQGLLPKRWTTSSQVSWTSGIKESLLELILSSIWWKESFPCRFQENVTLSEVSQTEKEKDSRKSLKSGI